MEKMICTKTGEITMNNAEDVVPLDFEAVAAAADRAARAVPPLWPLSCSVAVNPYLGQSNKSLAHAGARLARVAGSQITMPRRWYRQKMAADEISDQDLLGAWSNAPLALRPESLAALKAAASEDSPKAVALPTVADLAANVSAIDWPRLISERVGAWAAAYFDEGQALWKARVRRAAYPDWRFFAMHDLSPEIAGLSGFSRHVSEFPDSAAVVIARVVNRLGLRQAALETYFHQMLVTLGGWAQYARYHLWQAERVGRSDQCVVDLLAIRLVWEEALFEQYETSIAAEWAGTRARHTEPIQPTRSLIIDSILQEAWERSNQRKLARVLARPAAQLPADRPALQAAFCIDVRSEVFRRALESLDPRIQTLGFAGFFGVGTRHRRFASDVEELRLPVLLDPALFSFSGGAAELETSIRIKRRAKRAWGRFKLAAVSSFAFVEAAGPAYIGKLISDVVGRPSSPPPAEPAPVMAPPPDLASRAKTAETVLRAMSLTSDFARLVLLVGHGASLVNNPHASSLQCGACGGHAGDVNARLLASLLNDPEVRAGLAQSGINIPSDTTFLGALHDTVSDEVVIYADDQTSPDHRSDLARAKDWFGAAGKLARSERALRLPRASGSESALAKRGRDWAETRPEWGLTGCSAFIAAPRAQTTGKNLAGRAFLHDYDWMADKGFAVLELILTAPVVVASWINLQYYGSTVAPDLFGAGNKLLHNVTGGIGVVEGNSGLLRSGLPWQSVHDGEIHIHEPMRLSVCIEAPQEAISAVLERHGSVRELFDNRWLHLFALNERGRMAWQYNGALQWEALEELPYAPKLTLASA
jgi:uncharacterized protein YbcC (UPF0753/DUF2309 family)